MKTARLSWHRLVGLRFPLLLALLATVGCVTDVASRQSVDYDRGGIKRLVAAEAQRMRVPVPLALAVAHAESNFDARALSAKGARGVMQIMPATARDEYAIQPSLLWDPKVNIRLGLHFLSRLLRRYGGRVDLALSYYNGGSAVGDLPRARIIPATFRYVRKVQRFRLDYRRRIWRGAMDD